MRATRAKRVREGGRRSMRARMEARAWAVDWLAPPVLEATLALFIRRFLPMRILARHPPPRAGSGGEGSGGAGSGGAGGCGDRGDVRKRFDPPAEIDEFFGARRRQDAGGKRGELG